MKIGVISDTHSYIPKDAINYLKNCNEIWHAGDIGNIDILKKLESVNTTRAVFGNIDNEIIRRELNKYLIIKKQNIVFLIIHIAGKPPNYNKKTRDLIKRYKPNVIICGHSHILKIDKDNINNLLFINPGAIGKIGFHKKKTMIRFCINESKINNMEVIELN